MHLTFSLTACWCRARRCISILPGPIARRDRRNRNTRDGGDSFAWLCDVNTVSEIPPEASLDIHKINTQNLGLQGTRVTV